MPVHSRIAVIAWTPESNAMAMRQLLAPYAPPPPDPAPPPPWNWGTEDGARGYLGADFALGHEVGVLHMRCPDAETAWRIFSEGFGPVKMVADSLERDRRQELAESFIAWCEEFRTDLGVAIPAEYLVTAGRRK